jgi:hypothetical protein
MLWNVRPLAPIVVWATLSAVPVAVAIVFVPVTLTVPPLVAAGPGPVAEKPAVPPVESVRPPVKLIVAPVFVVRVMPPPASFVSVMAPENATVPPVWFVTSTDAPEPLPIVPG